MNGWMEEVAAKCQLKSADCTSPIPLSSFLAAPQAGCMVNVRFYRLTAWLMWDSTCWNVLTGIRRWGGGHSINRNSPTSFRICQGKYLALTHWQVLRDAEVIACSLLRLCPDSQRLSRFPVTSLSEQSHPPGKRVHHSFFHSFIHSFIHNPTLVTRLLGNKETPTELH